MKYCKFHLFLVLRKFKKLVKSYLRNIIYYDIIKERKKDMQKKIQIIPDIMWIPLIFTFLLNTIVYYGARLLVANKYHYERGVYVNKKIRIWIIVAFILIILILSKQFFNQKFDSVASLQNYIKGFGIAAPLILTLFQALQVIVPILPGYFGCIVGAVAFGSTIGFFCNYIGISAGSIIAYFLAKKYGIDMVLTMFSKKQYEKWSEKIKRSKSYERFLFIATILPLFPDDFLCYFSGLVKMNSKKFVWIILLGKPWCILAYSIIFGMIQ